MDPKQMRLVSLAQSVGDGFQEVEIGPISWWALGFLNWSEWSYVGSRSRQLWCDGCFDELCYALASRRDDIYWILIWVPLWSSTCLLVRRRVRVLAAVAWLDAVILRFHFALFDLIGAC